MSLEEVTKVDLKTLSYDDLIKLGETLIIKHVADSLEKNEDTKKEEGK